MAARPSRRGSGPEAAGAGAVAARLDDRRMHFQHGPIDLIATADGPPGAVDTAFRRAGERFVTLLDELVSELTVLRTPVTATIAAEGRVARRMVASARAFLPEFSTPMIAVAGAVADEIRAVMCDDGDLDRCVVNNGGDISFHLASDAMLRVGVVGDVETGSGVGRLTITADHPCRGIATSGRQGRSASFGIADSVTVLAPDATVADTAATLIANRVDLPGHPAVEHRRARELWEDTDLGERPVVVEVGALSPDEIDEALSGGAAYALDLVGDGRILGAVLTLRGAVVRVWPPAGGPTTVLGTPVDGGGRAVPPAL